MKYNIGDYLKHMQSNYLIKVIGVNHEYGYYETIHIPYDLYNEVAITHPWHMHGKWTDDHYEPASEDEVMAELI